MSIHLMSEVFRLDLSSTDKLVLLALADAANDEGHTWIPVKRRGEQLDQYGRKKLDLLIKTGLCERAVQLSIKRLVEGQYLTRNERSGKGVEYMVTPARNAGRTSCGGVRRAPTPARSTGKSSITVSKKESPAREVPDDWKPEAKEGSETAKFMATWPSGFQESEVERFVAYHKQKKTKSENFNRQWATWVLGPYCRKALKEWIDERSSGIPSSNAFTRAAARRLGGGGGERRAGASTLR